MEKKLLEFTTKVLNMTEDEVKETLTEENGGLDKLQKAYADHLKNVKDAGYKAAERKVNKTWEEKIKADFELQSDAQGTQLIDEVQQVLEERVSKQQPEKKEITEAMLKKQPYVLELENKLQNAEKTTAEKYEKLLAEKEEAYQQKELFNEVKGVALAQFESLKPVLSTDPHRAKAQKDIFIDRLANYKFMKEKDEIIVLKADGERLDDETTGHRVKFEDVVKNITTQYFDLQAAEPRSSSGRKQEESTTAPTVAVPKSREEYGKLLADTSIPHEQKKAIQDAWYASQS